MFFLPLVVIWIIVTVPFILIQLPGFIIYGYLAYWDSQRLLRARQATFIQQLRGAYLRLTLDASTLSQSVLNASNFILSYDETISFMFNSLKNKVLRMILWGGIVFGCICLISALYLVYVQIRKWAFPALAKSVQDEGHNVVENAIYLTPAPVLLIVPERSISNFLEDYTPSDPTRQASHTLRFSPFSMPTSNPSDIFQPVPLAVHTRQNATRPILHSPTTRSSMPATNTRSSPFVPVAPPASHPQQVAPFRFLIPPNSPAPWRHLDWSAVHHLRVLDNPASLARIFSPAVAEPGTTLMAMPPPAAFLLIIVDPRTVRSQRSASFGRVVVCRGIFA